MGRSKVAITLSESILDRLDKLVQDRVYSNRSEAIETAVEEKLSRIEKRRLVEECAKLDPTFERTMAEEGLAADLKEWPNWFQV